MTIQCYVEPLGRPSPEGLEAVELYVCREFESMVQKPLPKQRVDISILMTTGAYRGGLRTYPGNGQIYVCPDLESEDDGRNVSLAKALSENGIESKIRVDVLIEQGRWKISSV
jgi:hypothetical protein